MKRKIMKKHTIFCFTACVLLLSSSGAFPEELVHILQKGETLYGISRRYKVPADAIMSFNKLTDPDKLRAGQKIRIPDVYEVQKGDTLYGIARKFGVSVQDLTGTNGLSGKTAIKAGDVLYIPGSAGNGKSETPSGQESPVSPVTAAVASAPPEKTVPAIKDSPGKGLEDPRNYKQKKVDSSIIWPVKVKEIAYLSGKLYGVSILSDKGEQVKAISSGTVLSTGPYRGFGQVVFLQSKTGHIYVYGGLVDLKARQGDRLAFGDDLGTLGSDSLSGKPQLYFMVYNNDVPVDPAKAPRGY